MNGPGGGLVANSKRAQSAPQKVWTENIFVGLFFPGNGLVTVIYAQTDRVNGVL